MTQENELTLEQIVQQVKTELNPDGAGYHTSEAADGVFAKASEGCGYLTASMRDIGRRGAASAVKEYDIKPQSIKRKLSTAIEAAASGQQDFAYLTEGWEWVDNETALEEGVHAVRKTYRELILGEAKQVVTLKLKKSREAAASAERTQKIIDTHPEWEESPDLTMGQILGLD
jgi:hypothetical protein